MRVLWLVSAAAAVGCLEPTERIGEASPSLAPPAAGSEPTDTTDPPLPTITGPVPLPNPARDPGATTRFELPGFADEPLCEPVAPGEQLAFPGAEGFGRFAAGGRGGEVYHVTSLADDFTAGTLRAAVSAPGRTVVFDVGGWITLQSDLTISANQLTIAGQTAPGGGIGIRGMKLAIAGSDIIVRFVRVRKGDITSSTDRDDAMAINSPARRVIIDHVSVGYGTDENFSMPGDETVGPADVTVQWTLIGYALQRNNHSAGSLLTANGLSIHHTLWGFNKTRNPRARSQDGAVLDWVNNVIYGWNARDPAGESLGWDIDSHAFILGGTSSGVHRANVLGNYFVAREPASAAFVSGMVSATGEPSYGMFFFDNLLDGNANGQLDVSSDDETMIDGAVTLLEEPLDAPRVCRDAPSRAFDVVTSEVGATLPERDEVDRLLIQSVREQSGELLQREADLELGEQGYGTLAAGIAPLDTDQDGMPDEWEDARGLSAVEPEDRNADDDDDGYTNLEAYLNELASPAFQRALP